jgi:hypothetical protein
MALPRGGRLVGGQPVHFPEGEFWDEPNLDYETAVAAGGVSLEAERMIGSAAPAVVSPTAATGSVPSEQPAAFDDERAPDEIIGIPIVSERVAVTVERNVVGVPVVADEEAADVLDYGSIGPAQSGAQDSSESAEPMALPIDALESAERLIARRRSNGGSRVTSRPEERRVAEASPEWQVQAMPDQGQVVSPSDEAWPSINWLRPN